MRRPATPAGRPLLPFNSCGKQKSFGPEPRSRGSCSSYECDAIVPADSQPLEEQMVFAVTLVCRPVGTRPLEFSVRYPGRLPPAVAEHLHRTTIQRLLLEPKRRLRDFGISREVPMQTPRVRREVLIQAMSNPSQMKPKAYPLRRQPGSVCASHEL